MSKIVPAVLVASLVTLVSVWGGGVAVAGVQPAQMNTRVIPHQVVVNEADLMGQSQKAFKEAPISSDPQATPWEHSLPAQFGDGPSKSITVRPN